MTRKALGRGLSALIGESAEEQAAASSAPEDGGLRQVPASLIDPNPYQPRSYMNEAALQQLAESIRQAGVVQPVLVRAAGDRYQIVAGERRWRAARLAGLDTIPAVVRAIADAEALEIALTENVLREDLTAVEVARAYAALQERFGYTQDQLAAKFCVDRSTVSNALRLLKLPEAIIDLIEAREISGGHARALLACKTPEDQLAIAQRIAREGISVRQAERLASRAGGATAASESKESEAPPDPNLRAAVAELERALGTRVKIVGSETGGRIEIRYYSSEDLNRIYDLLTKTT